MIANYHVHTSRCRHADGTDEEYIKKAIAEGLKILGFSDHAPYIYPDGYVSYYKMTPEESFEYFSSISALREKYRDEIEIHIGYEAEYYPLLWDKTYAFWEQTNRPEYLILGQHFVTEEYIKEGLVHSADGTDRPDMMTMYADEVIAAINTGSFSYIAHPDVINFQGGEDIYREQMTRVIEAAISADIPLEINLLGLTERRNYPNPTFWELAASYSPRVILGCDAHSPTRVADQREIAAALRFADKYHLNVVDKINLIDPFKKE